MEVPRKKKLPKRVLLKDTLDFPTLYHNRLCFSAIVSLVALSIHVHVYIISEIYVEQ